MIAPTDFNIETYIAWLTEVGSTHVIAPATAKRPPTERWVALQHDVDLSLDWACRLAEAEHAIGVHSIFNVQVGCAFYDIAAPRSLDNLDTIAGWGHKIGLHFDWRRYDEANVSLRDGLARDAAVLKAIGHKPQIVCAHKPLRQAMPDGLGAITDLPTPQRDDEIYVSDSARGFSFEGMKALTEPAARIRLNTHPAWWVADVHGRAETVARAGDIARARIRVEENDWSDIATHPHAIAQDQREALNHA